MPELLVIADDLTGALDTGAPFAARGIATRVVCGRALDGTQVFPGVRVVCIDTETRHLPPEEAYRVTRALAREAVAAGIRVVFKKIDSTLRGPVGGELAAVADALPDGPLALAPAFPSAGRTTRGGWQYLNGRPIHETEFANDPFAPVLHSDISKIIRAQRNIEVIPVPVGQEPPARAAGRIEVYDAVTGEDMRAVAVRLLAREYRGMAGCAGLAAALAAQMAGPGPEQSPKPRKTEGLLAVCGSLNPISERQMAYAEREGFARLAIPALATEAEAEAEAFCARVHALSRQGVWPILHVPAENGRDVSRIGRDRPEVARQIGRAVYAWYRQGLDHTLAITGGDTLYAFLERVGPRAALEPVCELGPGVVCAALNRGENRVPMQIISKAGGLGAESVFRDIARAVLPSG